MAKNKLKVVDKGWDDIKKKMLGLKIGKAASVGVQGSEAGEDHGGPTNVMIGSVHEFGSKTVPQRPHWRSTFDEKQSKYQKEMDKIAKRVYEPGQGTIDGDLLLLGEMYKKDVIDKIKSKLSPSLADGTIAHKKGEDTPLIDTGQYINSFTAIVVKETEVDRS